MQSVTKRGQPDMVTTRANRSTTNSNCSTARNANAAMDEDFATFSSSFVYPFYGRKNLRSKRIYAIVANSLRVSGSCKQPKLRVSSSYH